LIWPRLRLGRLCRNAGGSTFFPWASPIPREPRKSHRHPPLRFGPKTGAAAIAFGLQIAIEVAMVAGSNSQGEVTWQISAPSRSPATTMGNRPRRDRKPQRFRQTEASRLVRAARDAGVPIKEIKLRPDGTIGLIVGDADSGPSPEPPRDTSWDDLKSDAPD
jgi:hypothetical protein